jgi:hypothetical protein
LFLGHCERNARVDGARPRLRRVEFGEFTPCICRTSASGDGDQSFSGERRQEVAKNRLITRDPLRVGQVVLMHVVAFVVLGDEGFGCFSSPFRNPSSSVARMAGITWARHRR